ncbi:MAG: ABC transporter substrate-binding protein [Tenericutes bacterium]|nr:ABC transporter substrate-binding protein [Mycoplasmatota bacterium]
MKKNILYYCLFFILVFLMVCSLFLDFNHSKKNENKRTKVTLAEVAHTIFYAPQYVAIEKGYFKEVGIDIELILTAGADKVTAAVLSGDADIGFCGSEGTIYVYNAKEKDYLKTFAQLTQKDGSFLVSREKIDNFTLNDLKGKSVIGGRAGGMPEMTFEWALKQNGIDPKNDLEIDTSIAFAAMGGAFISGQGDFVTLFEPNALEIEQQGYGYVVASIGELGGVVPYTSYSARGSYIEKNSELISNFTKAIQKGLDFVHNSSNKEVAEAILSQFPDTSLNDLEKVVARYRKIDAWPKTTKFSEESFDHLQDIMIDNGVLNSKVSYDKLIYSEK